MSVICCTNGLIGKLLKLKRSVLPIRDELHTLALYVYVPPGTATAVDIEIAIAAVVAHLSHPSAEHLPGEDGDDAEARAWWPETERLHVDDVARTRWLAEVGDALTHRRVQRMAARIGATHRRLREAGSPAR